MTKLMSENKADWDEHLLIVFFSYIIAYKVAKWYIAYQLMYELHPLMPIKYVLLAFSGDHRDANPIRVFINKLIDLEKLQTNKLQAQETIGNQQWNRALWNW